MIVPLPIPATFDAASLVRDCQANRALLLALFDYVRTIPGAPPLPAALSKLDAKLQPAHLQAIIDPVDEAVAGGSSVANRLLHDAGCTWDEATALVRKWPALSCNAKRAALESVIVRATMTADGAA